MVVRCPRASDVRVAALLALAVVTAACTRSPDPGARRLLDLPETLHGGTVAIAEDGKTWAFVETTPAGERIVARGFTGPLHARVARPQFAPRTNALYYWAKDPVGEDEHIVFAMPDGRTVPTDLSEPGPLVFSADGSRVAAAAIRRDTVPGETGSDGRPVIRERVVMLVDGVEIGRWARTSQPSFSPDGKHVAFVHEDEDGRGAVVVDGEVRHEIAPVEGTCATAVMSTARTLHSVLTARWLPDGKLLALGRDRDGFSVYLDDERVASYPTTQHEGGSAFVVALDDQCRVRPAIAPRSFRVAEKAPVAAWWERIAGNAERWRVVRNGAPVDDVLCDAPWEGEPPQLSADGRQCAYACVTLHGPTSREVAVITPGGKRHGPYAGIWGISFDDDGEHVTWGASNGAPQRAWSIYADGVPVVERAQAVFRPRFTPDGSRVVWEAQRSPRGRYTLGVGPRRLAAFDEVYWGPEFPTRDRVAWVVRRRQRIVRIVADVR